MTLRVGNSTVTTINNPWKTNLPDQTVRIRSDRIAWVGPAGEARVPDGAEVLDATGKFLIPGLWDMHVHLQWDWDAEVSLPLFLAYGITGVRDMASDWPVCEASTNSCRTRILPDADVWRMNCAPRSALSSSPAMEK